MGTVMAEWGNTSRSFSSRVSRLRNGADGLFAFLGTGTVIRDARTDQLAGGGASDWIFRDIEGSVSDNLIGATSSDTTTPVS
jgi:hypothetical protein